MRKVVQRYLDCDVRRVEILTAFNNQCLTVKDISDNTSMPRDTVNYIVKDMVENLFLTLVVKKDRKIDKLLNHYAISEVKFVPKTIEELELIYPVGYFTRLKKAPVVDGDVKGKYDDLIAANPNLRIIKAKWETHPELFVAPKRKPINYGIPSSFNMV